MKERPVPDVNAADKVYSWLLASIVSGQAGPGARIIERDVALAHDISRTPVRQAVKRLEREGFLVSSGGERSFAVVSPLTISDVLELATAIAVLEGSVAATAARSDRPTRAAVCIGMRHDLSSFRSCLAKQARNKIAILTQLDASFHDRYVGPFVGARVANILPILRSHFARYTMAYSEATHVTWELYESEHEPIVRAIERGSANAAESAVRRNWEQSGDRFAGLVRLYGERGTALLKSTKP